MTEQHADQAPALTAQYEPPRACELVRERLAEADAVEHVPAHILADLDQILSEVLDLPQPGTSLDTEAVLDALPVGTVLRNGRGHVWVVDEAETDGTELRYAGAGVKDYYTTRVFLEMHGPFTVIWAPGGRA